MPKKKPLKVVELFAGVGGFRLGLEGFMKKGEYKSSSTYYKKPMPHPQNYKIVWSNQNEPGRSIQYANKVYNYHFGDLNDSIHSEILIEKVDFNSIPEHDMLVGGFPCQDFSVGALNKRSGGLKGKKGVLWYQIQKILKHNINQGHPTKYILLENVDRLLKCPVNIKGADFTTILDHLNSLEYAVEWKVINAGEYDMPQRRKRVFILCYHKGTDIYQRISSDSSSWLRERGVLATSFKSNENSKVGKKANFTLDYAKKYIKSRLSLSHSDKSHRNYFSNYMADKKIGSLFQNSGVMFNGNIITAKLVPEEIENKNPLKKFLELDESLIKEEFIVSEKEYLEKWKPTKNSKKRTRKSEDKSFEYQWSEGKMAPFDNVDFPSRTIITSEGGKSALRTKHIIKHKNGYRRLLPSELDRLSMFPKDFTKVNKIPDSKRAFLVGNALVVGVIEKIGIELINKIHSK